MIVITWVSDERRGKMDGMVAGPAVSRRDYRRWGFNLCIAGVRGDVKALARYCVKLPALDKGLG